MESFLHPFSTPALPPEDHQQQETSSGERGNVTPIFPSCVSITSCHLYFHKANWQEEANFLLEFQDLGFWDAGL
jgi:hypothetical protein